ncbi:MAG: hypothetical protein VZS44_06205 [Bacilli bacterium]|nr:hypothetical protein [Bacilli bacterium]
MASFAMHYIAGEKFLESLDCELTNYDKSNFRLGNLVVDTMGISNYDRDEKLRRKLITHFRNKEDDDKCIQIPNVDKFRDKYKDLLGRDYSVMGYLFHLYTDKIFFEYLYKDVIKTLDKDMKQTNIKKDGIFVKVLKNNKIFKLNDFYSGSSIGGLYRDYSNMNKYLINKYKIIFDYDQLKDFSDKYFNNPGIEEIDYNNIYEVIDKMNDIFKEALNSEADELEVFNINDIENFIYRTVDGFNNKYRSDIKRLAKNR